MNRRLIGISRTRAAIICAVDTDSSVPLVLKIMRGEAPRSSIGRRVVKWCEEHGYPIDRPASTGDVGEDALARAERVEAERAARRGGG